MHSRDCSNLRMEDAMWVVCVVMCMHITDGESEIVMHRRGCSDFLTPEGCSLVCRHVRETHAFIHDPSTHAIMHIMRIIASCSGYTPNFPRLRGRGLGIPTDPYLIQAYSQMLWD